MMVASKTYNITKYTHSHACSLKTHQPNFKSTLGLRYANRQPVDQSTLAKSSDYTRCKLVEKMAAYDTVPLLY